MKEGAGLATSDVRVFYLPGVCQVSHTCEPLGFRFCLPAISACCAPWISIYATAGGVLLGGSHSLTLTSKASVQHVQVVSHLYVCKKFRVEGSFHILRNPAVDRWFKYVLRKKKLFLGLLFYTLPHILLNL